MSIVKVAQHLLCHRLPQGGFDRLEPDDGKLSSPVLRGGSGGNAASLPDNE
jgi:hypothetical protein